MNQKLRVPNGLAIAGLNVRNLGIAFGIALLALSNVFGQVTFPSAQPLPYTQNFNVVNSLTYPSDIQGFRSGALTTFDYAEANSILVSNRVISSVIDLNTITTAGTGVSTSTIHLITTTGNNSLAISLLTRACGFVTAIQATGFQDVRVSYNITMLEQESISSILGFAYLQYSVAGMSGFASVPGSFFSTQGLTPGQITAFTNLPLPNVDVADKSDVRLRWLAFPNNPVNGYISFAVDDISVIGNTILFSSLAAQPLPYVPAIGSLSNVSGFPAGLAGFRTGALASYDYATATAATPSNRTLSAPDYDIATLTSGGANTASTLHVVTTPGYASLVTSLFSRSAGYIMALNTSGWRNIKLSFDVLQLEVEAIPTATGFGYFEYRTDNYSAFSTIPGAFYSSSGKSTGQRTSFVNLTLPGVVENLSKIQIRWLAFPSTLIGTYLSFGISNVSITGDNIPAPASKLVVESVTPSQKIINSPLTIVVVSRNPGDQEVPVINATQFTLSTTGTGLVGAGTYTITGGTSRITITGLSFSAANSGISISANRTVGDVLSNGTSTLFDILATNPDAPVGIPYIQDFGTTPIASGTNTISGMRFYRAGSGSWRSTLADAALIVDGSFTLRNYQGAIDASTRCTSTLTGHPNNGLGPQSYSNGTDVKLNISLGSRTFQNVLSLNTTGAKDLSYKYEVQLVENFSTASNSITTATGYLAFQYRVGSVAGWNTLPNSTYTTGTTLDQVTTFIGYLPQAAENQPLVQVRWITFQSNDLAVTDYLSFALDNIEIASKQATKIAITDVSPTSPTAGFPFSLTFVSQNDYGVEYPVGSATGITLSAGGTGTLSGVVVTTLGAGISRATLTALSYSTATTGLVLTVATTSGQTLVAGTRSIDVVPFVGATKLVIAQILPESGTKILPGLPFKVVVNALNNADASGVVSTNTTIALAITGGSGSLGGTTSATLTSGQSSITISGVTYSQADAGLTLTASATAGDALTSSPASTSFNVGKIATSLQILGVFPAGSIRVGAPITVRLKLLDNTSEGGLVLTNTPVTIAVSSGIGSVSGTLTGTFLARTDSIIDVKGVLYSAADTNVVLSASITGFALATSAPFSVFSDPLAGITVLYKEDFEKTIKVAGQPNPAIPNGMKMYNRDGQAGIPAFYNDYGTDAYVIRRIRQRGYTAIVEDVTPTQGKTIYFDNSGSAFPDSNFVAFSTSYFNNDPALNPTADRWLVTPKIDLIGKNLKLSVQAMSFTSSGNFEDQFQLLYSESVPGTSLNPSDWEALTMKAEGLVNYPDSATFTALTAPVTYSVSLPALFEGASVCFAVRLVTPSPGGDRIAVDNIFVTSSDQTNVTNDTNDALGLGVYPNPASETVTLSYSSKAGLNTISVIAMSGEEVISESYVADGGPILKKLSVASLTTGIYILKVVTPQGVRTSKVSIK